MKLSLMIIKHLFLFFVGGIGYYVLELLYRGKSHSSMLVCGGFCFLFIGLLNEQTVLPLSFFQQMLLGSLIITTLELFTGLLVNRLLHLNIWNYEEIPYNFLGQICLSYSALWFLLSAFVILLDDFLRLFFFLEPLPSYSFF